MRQAQLFHNPTHKMIHKGGHAVRLMVKARAGRHDHRPSPMSAQHVAQMHAAERSFAHHQHQGATLFKADIGSPVQQIRTHAVRNGGQRGHRARADNHPVMRPRTAGRRSGHVIHSIQVRTLCFQLCGVVAAFITQDLPRSGRNNPMYSQLGHCG